MNMWVSSSTWSRSPYEGNTARKIDTNANYNIVEKKDWYVDAKWNLSNEKPTTRQKILSWKIDTDKECFVDQTTRKVYLHKPENIKNGNIIRLKPEKLEESLEIIFAKQQEFIQETNQKAHKNISKHNENFAEEEKNDKMSDLMNQLEEKENENLSLKERVKILERKNDKNRTRNSDILSEYMEYLKWWWNDPKVIQEFKYLINKYNSKKEKIYEEVKNEFANYEVKKLETLDNSWFLWSIFRKKTKEVRHEGGKKIVTVTKTYDKLRFNKERGLRDELNKTIRTFNSIGDKPKRWVTYILSKAHLEQWWSVTAFFKKIRNWLKIRDIDAFDKLFDKNMKIFISDLEEKIKQWYTNIEAYKKSDDYDRIKALTKRAQYYARKYKENYKRTIRL